MGNFWHNRWLGRTERGDLPGWVVTVMITSNLPGTKLRSALAPLKSTE